MLRSIEAAYPESYIDSVKIINISGTTFVYFKEDEKYLSDNVYDVLSEIACNSDVDNPVYISFSETVELLLD